MTTSVANDAFSDHGLSRRAINCLISEGITDPENVRFMSDKELLGIPNLGLATLRELRNAFQPATDDELTSIELQKIQNELNEIKKERDALRHQIKTLLNRKPTSEIDDLTRRQIQDVHNVMLQLVTVYEGLCRGLSEYSEIDLLDELRKRKGCE